MHFIFLLIARFGYIFLWMITTFSFFLTYGKFLVANCRHFVNLFFEKRIFCQNFPVFKKIIFKKMKKDSENCHKWPYNISTCIFWILLNIAKYTYGSQNWKEKKKRRKRQNPKPSSIYTVGTKGKQIARKKKHSSLSLSLGFASSQQSQ